MRSKVHQDVWVGCFILLFCGVFFSLSHGKPGNAMLFPIILLSILSLMALPIIWGGIRKSRAASVDVPIDNAIQWGKLKTPFIAYLFIAGYVFLFWLAGYFVATLIFLPSLMWHFRLRNPTQIGLVTTGYAIIIYALFVKQLNVPVLHFGYLERVLSL